MITITVEKIIKDKPQSLTNPNGLFILKLESKTIKSEKKRNKPSLKVYRILKS
jgi:hypothetical protein